MTLARVASVQVCCEQGPLWYGTGKVVGPSSPTCSLSLFTSAQAHFCVKHVHSFFILYECASVCLKALGLRVFGGPCAMFASMLVAARSVWRTHSALATKQYKSLSVCRSLCVVQTSKSQADIWKCCHLQKQLLVKPHTHAKTMPSMCERVSICSSSASI